MKNGVFLNLHNPNPPIPNNYFTSKLFKSPFGEMV
jgi:hypothetical protein